MSNFGRLPQIEEGEIHSLTLAVTSAGACLRGRYSGTGRRVAVKLLPNSPSHRRDWVKQEKVKSQPHNAYSERVLVPLGWYQTKIFSGVVWEWMSEGSLHALLCEKRLHSEIPICLRLQILLDVAEGLSYLHSIPLPHMALTATHVLFDRHYRAKLCDWGLFELCPREKLRPCYRNLAYFAPEALQGNGSLLKADMYSFGVLAWETLNLRQASEDFAQLQILCGTDQCMEQRSENNLLPSDTPNVHALTELVMRCWDADPQSRPSAEDCILELRKALLTFDPVAPSKAALNLKTFKERALLNCKDLPAWEIPIELNNLEMNFSDNKYMPSKTLPMDIPQLHQQRSASVGSSPSKSSPLQALPRTGHHPISSSSGGTNHTSSGSEPSGSCGVHSNPTVQCTCEGWAISPPHHSPSPPSKSPSPSKSPPCPGSSSSPTQPIHSQSRSRNQGQPGSSPPRRLSCKGLLVERRELIVRNMTEGRLNHLLDVLRARRALSYEAYEIITATVTLAARTRSLLDTCCCLGEKVAALVAVTLGLVSASTTTTTTTSAYDRENKQLAHSGASVCHHHQQHCLC